MPVQLITYDLIQPGQNYSSLRDAIKEISGVWWHHLESVWLVETHLSSRQVRDALQPWLDANDKLLVVELEGDWATAGIPERGTSWLQNHL